MSDLFLPEHVQRDVNVQRAKMIARLLNDIVTFGGSVAIIDEAVEVQPIAQDELTMPILIGFDKNTGKYETA